LIDFHPKEWAIFIVFCARETNYEKIKSLLLGSIIIPLCACGANGTNPFERVEQEISDSDINNETTAITDGQPLLSLAATSGTPTPNNAIARQDGEVVGIVKLEGDFDTSDQITIRELVGFIGKR
jgi:hypothetical protein